MEKQFFEQAGKLDAWNYAISMRNATEFVRTGYHLVKFLIEKRKNNLQEIILKESFPEDRRVSFPPGDAIIIGNQNYSIHLLLQMCTQSIFQSAHSFFDYLAQFINCIYFNTPLQESDVSFSKVRKKCNNLTIAKWMEDLEDNIYYKLICDFNNKTKHYEILNLILRFAVDDYEVTVKTSGFSKQTKEGQHSYGQYNLVELTEKVYELLHNSFQQIDVFTTEELIKQEP